MSKSMNLQQYLGKEILCDCGRKHSIDLKRIDIEAGALKHLPSHIKELGYQKVYVVCDVNTWEAAGAQVVKELEEEIAYKTCILESKELIPDEQAVGTIIMELPKDADLILAVGSGTLNDLCKFISFQLKMDYMIFATAPSMDGFVSVGAALITKHVKVTYSTHVPVAVIGDTDILVKAPMEMIVAGLGDILGKYTCLLDWKMANLIEGEYYCETIVNMVKESIQIVSSESQKMKQREQEAIQHLMEALVLTGLAMSFVGNSRPASGSEHHLSHYWEMQFQMENKKPILHGIKVGIGMISVMKMYQMLAREEIHFEEKAGLTFDYEAWKSKVESCYKDAAAGILDLEEKCKKNSIENRNRRLQVMKEKWPQIQEVILTELPELEEIQRKMLAVEEPINPKQIGVSSELVEDAIILAKEVRDRFTILQILWDLGLLSSYAKKVSNYFATEQEID